MILSNTNRYLQKYNHLICQNGSPMGNYSHRSGFGFFNEKYLQVGFRSTWLTHGVPHM